MKKSRAALFLASFFLLLNQLAITPLSAQSGQLSGSVRDLEENQALTFASVALHQSADSSQVSGVLADSLGQFVLTGIKAGDYYLSIRFLGYKRAQLAVADFQTGEKRDMGSIALQATQLLLDEIEISGRESRSFHQIDRQVYDAAQFQQAQGGSATDVLRNLPGVSVNGQGEISLRGSGGFMVMIDGRQMQGDAATLLSQLPANAIDDIEILTTPSAKYDPDGKGGIINIKMRRGATDGFFLLVNGQLGLPSIEPYDNPDPARRFGGDLTVNYRKGKWDLSAGLDYRRDDLAGRRVGYVNTYVDEVLTEYPSSGERSFDRYQYSGRFSARFRPGKRQSWNLSVNAGDRTQFRTADILYDWQQRSHISENQFLGPEAYWDSYQNTGRVFSGAEVQDSLTYYNENLRVRTSDFLIGALDYQLQVDESSQLLLSALYERSVLGGPTDNSIHAWPNLLDTLQYQYNTNENPLDGLRLKADYVRKVGKMSWESGYQYRFLSHPGDFLYQDRDLKNDQWIENPEFSNRIELKREIHSLYSQVSGKKNRLSYGLGVRLEYMNRQVRLAQPDTTYSYEILQPFPTLNLQYDLGAGWAAKTGYSRRIERTTTFKMTPFPEREHNETLEQGDAELLPEFINLAELGVIKTFGDNSVFATGYFRHIQNLINRVNTIYNDSILNRIYTNAGNAQVWGMEIGSNLYPAKWCELALGGNLYQYRIQGELFGEQINTAQMIYSLNATATFHLPADIRLQAGFNYLSERVTAQGVDSRFYNPSLSLRKTFLQGNMDLSIQWLSIDLGLLESNEQRITTQRDNFFTTTNYLYEVDRVMLSLSYRLNQPSKQMKFLKSEFGDKEF